VGNKRAGDSVSNPFRDLKLTYKFIAEFDQLKLSLQSNGELVVRVFECCLERREIHFFPFSLRGFLYCVGDLTSMSSGFLLPSLAKDNGCSMYMTFITVVPSYLTFQAVPIVELNSEQSDLTLLLFHLSSIVCSPRTWQERRSTCKTVS
jgi:hypothetical protein